MPGTNAAKALDPLEFRFTDPDDIDRYGDHWYTYAEADFLLLRARGLIQLERDLGMSIVSVMNAMRLRETIGDTAAAWLGVRAVDPAKAGEFDSFDPVTNLIEWRQAEGKAEASDEAMPTPPATPSPEPGPSPSTTSGTTDLVVLPNWPAAG